MLHVPIFKPFILYVKLYFQMSKLLAWRTWTNTSLLCGSCAWSQWPTCWSCSTSPPTSSSTAPSLSSSSKPSPMSVTSFVGLPHPPVSYQNPLILIPITCRCPQDSCNCLAAPQLWKWWICQQKKNFSRKFVKTYHLKQRQGQTKVMQYFQNFKPRYL